MCLLKTEALVPSSTVKEGPTKAMQVTHTKGYLQLLCLAISGQRVCPRAGVSLWRRIVLVVQLAHVLSPDLLPAVLSHMVH